MVTIFAEYTDPKGRLIYLGKVPAHGGCLRLSADVRLEALDERSFFRGHY